MGGAGGGGCQRGPLHPRLLRADKRMSRPPPTTPTTTVSLAGTFGWATSTRACPGERDGASCQDGLREWAAAGHPSATSTTPAAAPPAEALRRHACAGPSSSRLLNSSVRSRTSSPSQAACMHSSTSKTPKTPPAPAAPCTYVTQSAPPTPPRAAAASLQHNPSSPRSAAPARRGTGCARSMVGRSSRVT